MTPQQMGTGSKKRRTMSDEESLFLKSGHKCDKSYPYKILPSNHRSNESHAILEERRIPTGFLFVDIH